MERPPVWQPQWEGLTFSQKDEEHSGRLNICSKKGLSQAVRALPLVPVMLMPFGGAYQLTQNAMVAKRGGRRDQHLLRHGMGLQPS